MKQFAKMEEHCLVPIAQDINFIAKFVGGGVSKAIGVYHSAHSPHAAMATATAALFRELAMVQHKGNCGGGCVDCRMHMDAIFMARQ